MNRNIVFSLCYNTTDAVREAIKNLYGRNNKKDFQHFIVDLEFPLLKGNEIPKNIDLAKRINTVTLQDIASDYGSVYVKFPNVGVQQNHSQFYNYIKPDDSDVLIALDVDEDVITNGWVKAMADCLRSGKIGLVSLLQTDIEQYIDKNFYTIKEHHSYRMWVMKAMTNMALIGMSGEFLNKINLTLPFPESAKIYGYIESLVHLLAEHGYDWAILPDYQVFHLVQDGQLYREWKSWLIHQNISPQIPFEEWLKSKA